MVMTKAERALARLSDLASAEKAAVKAAEKARASRDRQVLAAYEAGCGYADLAATIRKTEDRVGQILKDQRALKS